MLFFKGMFFFSIPLGMLVAKREPTPCYHDAYSVGTPNWASWVKGWQKHFKTMVSPFLGRFFFGKQKNYFLFGCSFMGFTQW